MQTLSAFAAAILEQMEPNRGYEPSELRAFAPDASVERLRDIMHELWVQRQVERFGYTGWRRECSSNGASETDPGTHKETKAVRPEDLFDHGAFDGIFK